MSPDVPQHRFAPSATGTIGDVVPLSTEHYSFARINAPFVSATPHTTGANRTKQRSANTKSDRQLSKPLSTPHLRGPIMSESELDKKRNKLGYQRISIACAHCRRRKIRCLVAEDDSEQRCQNCIRLKKECVFYPVDQQAVLDARSEVSSMSGAPSAPEPAVSTSPQRGLEHHAFAVSYPASAMAPVTVAYQHAPVVPSVGMPTQGSFSPQAYPFHPSAQPVSQWAAADIASQRRQTPVSRTPSVQPPFARYTPGPTADIAPFPGSEPAGQTSSSVSQVSYGYNPEQMQQQNHGWHSHGPASRPIAYPEYPQNYPPYQQQQTTPSSYQRPPIMQQPTPGMIQMQHPMPPHCPPQYVAQHDQRSVSASGVLPSHYHPTQQVSWFAGGQSDSPAGENSRRVPSNYPYNNRPA